MTLDVEQIKRDMEAGTPGPWRRGQAGNCRIYGPDGAGAQSGPIAHVLWREFSQTVDTRRIARVPDLEAAFIEQNARIAELKAALRGVLTRYVELVASGDAGNWDANAEPEVKAARAALGDPSTWNSADIAQHINAETRKDAADAT